MAYAQATLTSANAASDLATVLDGLFTTAGWATVETLTPSGNYRNRIYKSPAASNLCGYDWYAVMCWTTLGTENYVEVWAAQAYDTGTKILSGILGADFSETPNPSYIRANQPTTGYFSESTFDLSSKTVSSSKSSIQVRVGTTPQNLSPGFQTLVPSSAFAYWMSVTLDHIGLFTSVATNAQNAVYSTLKVAADYVASTLYNPAPIVGWDANTFLVSSGLYGVPLATNQYRATHVEFSGTFGAKLPTLADEYYDAYAWKPNIYVGLLAGGTGGYPFQNTSLFGGVLMGAVPDIYLVWGGSIGDTVTIASGTYVLTGPLATNYSQGAQPSIALLVE